MILLMSTFYVISYIKHHKKYLPHNLSETRQETQNYDMGRGLKEI